MTPLQTLRLALDPAALLTAQGLVPDPWQIEFLRSPRRQVLLNCCRQSGKSTAVAALALHTALFQPASLVLLLSPSLRQSGELYRKVLCAHAALGRPLAAAVRSQVRLELTNGSRLVCLPGKEGTIRSFSGVRLLVLDEAARVPDDLYRSVRPMLAVSRGRLVCLSTPFGMRGFFHAAWTDPAAPWQRFRITWRDCPRISAEFIAEETRALGDAWVRQEYECSFESLADLVYPDFEALAGVDQAAPPEGRRVGGIDFGFRNPFCALWGVLDREDVLWLDHERYLKQTPIHEHAAALPREVLWYADPAGATEIEELRRADLKVARANNDIRAGIAAVTARLRTGRLKVQRCACPNLLAESRLYRYAGAKAGADGETPFDENNHALAALRYLVSKIDAGFLARFRRRPAPDAERSDGGAAAPENWLRLDNEHLWSD